MGAADPGRLPELKGSNMPTYKVVSLVEARDEDEARHIIPSLKGRISVERYYTDAEQEAYVNQCNENGDVPCADPAGHAWVISDEDENYCYCEKCGCVSPDDIGEKTDDELTPEQLEQQSKGSW